MSSFASLFGAVQSKKSLHLTVFVLSFLVRLAS